MYTKKHSGTSRAVYEKLKEQILHLELPPGSAISEIDTAAKYEMSRTPVRDAFKMLESEGLLEIRPHIGTFVSLIDLNMISDILYMREALEQSVLRDLAARYDKSQEFRIRLLLQQQRELLDTELPADELSRAFIISDNALHTALYDMAGKKNVMGFFRNINSQYERFRTFLNLSGRNDLLRLYHDHEKLWEYISQKEYDLLTDMISHHIYDGFNASTEAVHKHPEYFKSLK
ncbi:MAG: GntR family transcriptional regulator [Roseburia sp.]